MFQGIAKKQQPYFKFDPLIDSLFTNEETGLCTEALEPIKAREGPFTFHELICTNDEVLAGEAPRKPMFGKVCEVNRETAPNLFFVLTISAFLSRK